MPAKEVEALIERMKSDAAFRESVLKIEDIDARMDFVGREGYECRRDDIQLYLQNYVAKQGDEVIVLAEKGGCHGIYYGFCF